MTPAPMKLPAHLSRDLDQLFRRMDRAYHETAGRAGFVCGGCDDNCCLTRFYHHTLAEYLFLQAGLGQMPTDRRAEVRRRAEAAVERLSQVPPGGEPPRVMCPVNIDGRCSLYAWRPMICRLHGIPHLLQRPDGLRQAGPGCNEFYDQCIDSPEPRLDRTPSYVAMAALEQKLRRHFDFASRIKMTIAEMIVNEIH